MGNLIVGFYGGTFDPIHFGHLNLASSLMEAYGLDEVWFCPANKNPNKKETPSSTPLQRLEMVKLAIADIPRFSAIDLEIKREGPSYTIDTLRELSKTGHRFHLLLGEDVLADVSSWKEKDALLKLAPPLVGGRLLDISSTAIRDRLKQGLPCGHLVPAKVLDYIQRNHLY